MNRATFSQRILSRLSPEPFGLPGLLLSIFIILSFAPMLSAAGGEDGAAVDYRPQIHGALRARYEASLEDGEGSRFQVRNARVTLTGNVAPTIDYFIQTDLCDQGKMKILDAWGRIGIMPGLQFQAGQFRLPFGTDCFRAPSNYIFANRSFIGKQMNNVRGVGAKLAGTIPLTGARSLMLEGGAFNPTSMADHNVWVRELAYAAKASLSLGKVRLATGMQSIEPDSIRINLWGASATWTPDSRWTIEGEYMNKHYTHSAAREAHAWCLWADYGMPVKAGAFNRASFQARWDGMTPHSSGSRNGAGLLTVNHPRRRRITVGGTLTCLHHATRCDIRLDYEKYFYRHGVTVPEGDGDRITAEMVIRF